MIFLLLIFL